MSTLKHDAPFCKIGLDKSVPMPLYYQIESIIREDINSGKLKPGDKVLTEEKLQETFDVSRATIRRAIADLVHEGLLERNYSNGTIVTYPKIEESVSEVFSFTAITVNNGRDLESKILEFKKIKANEFLSNNLNIPKNSPLYFMKRIRDIDGTASCIEDWYAPVHYFENLKEEMFESKGMLQSSYYVLEKNYQVVLGRVEDTMSAVIADEMDVKYLNIRNGEPVLLRERVTFDSNNRAVVFSSGRYVIKIKVNIP